MPDKAVVPQFIDTEDKILGPITVRQFLIMLGSVFILFIEYKILTFWWFVGIGLPTLIIASAFSFVKINGQPFHIFFINFLQTSLRPPLRVWHKAPTEAELRALVFVKKEAVAPPAIFKIAPSASRLRDLSLVVNTGGVYNPEDDEEENL